MSDHVVDFSDVPDQPVVEEPARRGRPRSQETIERDGRVYDALASGPKTKEQLVEELQLKAELVYLSLYRLRRDGKVQKVVDGDVRNSWERVA